MPTWNSKAPRRPWEPERSTKKTTFSNNEHVHLYHTTQWRKLRKAKLAINPLCECDACKKRSVALPANVVDHIKPVKDGGDFWSMENLQSMNSTCHNRKSATERKQCKQQ